MTAYRCRACGVALKIEPPLSRDAECPECGHDVRCCINCRHYDPAYHNACHETEADPVADKHHRNFCEYMEPREPMEPGGTAEPAGGGSREADARARLDQLFGGARPAKDAPAPPAGASGAARPETREEAARRKLRELFGEGPGKTGGS